MCCGGKMVCMKDGNRCNELSCCVDLHSDHHFGLTIDDRRKYFDIPLKDFKRPSPKEIRENREHIERLRKRKKYLSPPIPLNPIHDDPA